MVREAVTAYAEERLADIRPEIEALTPQQWAEMAVGFEAFVMRPMWELYEEIERKDKLVLVTARREGVLTGYFGFMLHPFPSARATTAATSTPYYAIKGKWRGLVLRRMVRTAIKAAQERGAQMITIRNHVWAPAEPILKSLGFRPVETWYMLNLAKDEHHA